MTACQACGAENPVANRFCGSCGAPLDAVTCEACGTSNPRSQRFCGQCGSALDADGAPPTLVPAAAIRPVVDERKLATVLFADVVGFTSLSERSDPEVVARTVDAAFRRLGEVVERHGGTIDKYMGDSVLAVFGVPQAHDDDAERAVAAGLAMRDMGGDLAFSIGINSGEVMATAVGRAGDTTVIGDTVNVAARLEKAAGAGEVLVGRLTAELAGRKVIFREREPVVLKGKREPVDVWEAVALRPAGDGAGHDGTPLVGRDDELAFLLSQWRRVRRDGRTTVVAVVGEAGMGKTRLLDEVCQEIRGEGRVVRAAYPGYGTIGGAEVAVELVRQLGRHGDPEVDARVRSLAGELHPSLRSIDESALHQEQLWGVTRLLEARTAESPLLLVIDDLHNADSNKVGLLSDVAARTAHLPMLVLLAGRPEPPGWVSHLPAATTVRLGPLSRADAKALAAAYVGERPLTKEAAAFLVGRAGGNPLYLRELVSVAKVQGALVPAGDEYAVSERSPMPVTLQALLAARLDALEPTQKLALQLVSMLGDTANEEQVEGLGLARAGLVLQSLVGCGLLRQVELDGGSSSPEPGYAVIDPLLREVAYETLPRDVRAAHHRRAAGLAVSAEERSRHLAAAAAYLPEERGIAAEAAASLAAAGLELLDARRHADAIRVLERAVELGHDDPTALLRLANAHMIVGHDAEATAAALKVPADVTDPVVAAERRHLIAAAGMFRDPAEAYPELQAAAQDWNRLGNRNKEAWARANAGVALFNLSRMHEAGDELEEAADLFDAIGDRSGELSALSFLALVRPADPRVPRWLQEARDYAEQIGDRNRQLSAMVPLAWHRYFSCRLGGPEAVAEAEQVAGQLAELAAEVGGTEMEVHGWCLRASLARLTGRFDEAADLLERAVSAGAERGERTRDQALISAVDLSVSLARGIDDAAPCGRSELLHNPVVATAHQVEAEALVLAGRFDEALERLEGLNEQLHTSVGVGMAVVVPLAMLLSGRVTSDLVPVLRRVRDVCEASGAVPSALVATALLAEVNGDASDLPADLDDVPSISAALVLRARAVAGDADALVRLRGLATELVAPGLLAGLS